ncbi:MAG: hypothetical protein CML46_04925 [Rhodobacteraceae bacterium]|nr:hypothetical protein [Paracoccaceae bacterium]
MNYFRWIEPGARGRRGSQRASAEEARREAIRHVAADAASSDELAAQIWRSLSRGGWRIEEVGPSGQHVGWTGEAPR